MRKAAAGLLLSLEAMALCQGARAQAVDYGALQDLFGEPVTTSATGKPQRVSEAAANMEIITQEDIRRNGSDNLPDVLRFVTGVDVRTYGIQSQSVAIRGYNRSLNPRLLVLVNGRQVYYDSDGYVDWSNIPVQLDEIRQIEIVRGPASALFGFNASSGVINIITFDPLRDTTNVATFRGGSQGLVNGSLVGTMHDGDRAGVRVSLGGYRSNDFGSAPDGIGTRVAPQIGSFSLDSRVKITDSVGATFSATASDDRKNLPLIGVALAPIFNRSNSFGSTVTADTPAGVFGLTVYRNEIRSDLLVTQTSTDTYVVQATDILKLNAASTVRLELEYRNNTLQVASQNNATVGYSVLAASAMWDWRLTPTLSLTNAVRIDYLSLRASGINMAGSPFTDRNYDRRALVVPSFNSGLVYQLDASNTLRLTVGRGLQLPSLVDYSLSNTFGPFPLYNSPNLNPTSVDQVELALEHQLPAVTSTLKTAVFAQRNQDLITLGTNEIIPVLLADGRLAQVNSNIGSSDAVGIELGIRGKSESGFRWNASYAFEKIYDHLENLLPGPAAAGYRSGTPAHVVIAGAGYTIGRWDFDAVGRWQSSFTDAVSSGDNVSRVVVHDYLTAQAHIGYRALTNLTFGLTVAQLTRPGIQEAGEAPEVERRVIASATAHF